MKVISEERKEIAKLGCGAKFSHKDTIVFKSSSKDNLKYEKHNS